MMTTVKKMVNRLVSFFTAAAMTATMAALTAVNSQASDVSENQLNDMANEIAILVNEARVENGLEPIYVVPYLCDIADMRAEEVVVSFSHTRPDGTSFSTAVDTSIVNYSVVAENIAAGSDNAADTFEQWKESAGHWANILKPNITHMGVGVAYDPNSDYGWYWQQIFVQTDTEFADQYLPGDHVVTPKAEGDLTGDGVINSFDYVVLHDFINKKNTRAAAYLNDKQMATADCFRDGIISEADAKVMIRYILGEYKSIPYVF